MREKEDLGYPSHPATQLRLILSRGATPNGVYGFKMFSVRFDDLWPFRWTERLPGLRFIHLTRDDILGQAISDWRAEQSGLFRSTAAAIDTSQYNRRQIARRLARISRNDARWRQWFARNDIVPLVLRYEQVVANPQGVAAAVAELLGVNGDVPIDLRRVALRQQRDEVSAEWRERFVSEARDMSYLDNTTWRFLRARLGQVRRRLTGKRL
jgi:LPS sulfotransferase NodH